MHQDTVDIEQDNLHSVPSNTTMNLLHRAVVRIVMRIVRSECLVENAQIDHVRERPELAETETFR